MAKRVRGYAVSLIATDGENDWHSLVFILARSRAEAGGQAVTDALRKRPDTAIRGVIVARVPPLPTVATPPAGPESET